jgi:putative NADH-flavin reductase
VVAQAREQGHDVTGFVRATHGDATDRAALARVVPGHDALVSTLGRRALKSGNLMQNAMRALVSAMERAGVRRLVVMSSLGVGETLRDVPFIPRLMYRLFLTDLFADKNAAEDYLRGTALEWTFVYPVQLTDGPRTGRYRVGERLELSGIPKISRADVADFILRELRERAYVRKTAVISS